jgi:hypothetical protein
VHEPKESDEEMALTRKLLAALGIEDDKIDQIIEAHTETTDALKKQRDGFKVTADKVADLEKELETAKANAGDSDGFKAKFEAEHKAFEDFKADLKAREAHDAKANAARAYLKEKGIGDKSLGLALKALGADIDALELDGDSIKDAKSLDDALAGDLAQLVTTTTTKGADTSTPPANEGNTSGENIFGSTGTFFM